MFKNTKGPGTRMQSDSIPEIPHLKDASFGYILGANLLQILDPKNSHQKTTHILQRCF